MSVPPGRLRSIRRWHPESALLAVSLVAFMAACTGPSVVDTYGVAYRELRHLSTYVHHDGRPGLRAESLFDALDYEIDRLQVRASNPDDGAMLAALARARRDFWCAVRAQQLDAVDGDHALLVDAGDVSLAHQLGVAVDRDGHAIADRALLIGRCKAGADKAVHEFEYLMRTPR